MKWWPLAAGFIAALATAASAAVTQWGALSLVLATLVAFATVAWICIGFLWIKDRAEARSCIHGLSYVGPNLGLEPENERDCLQIGVKLANACQLPIKYAIDDFRVVIGDRTIASPDFENTGNIVAAGTMRTYRYPCFRKDQVREFLGQKVEGVLEFTATYGPADAKACRKLRMKLRLFLRLDEKPGISDIILSESETPA